MSNPSLLSAASNTAKRFEPLCGSVRFTPKYYTVINTDNTSETTSPTKSMFEQFKDKYCYNYNYIIYCNDIIRGIGSSSVCKTISVLVLVLIGFLIFYVCIISIGLLCVVFNYIFEKSMVFLIGQTLYNKNFPVCTNTQFIGGSCYTATSTYCR